MEDKTEEEVVKGSLGYGVKYATMPKHDFLRGDYYFEYVLCGKNHRPKRWRFKNKCEAWRYYVLLGGELE